jgi:2-polyprenyl-3-methyl-5-hydroxy-6-metoxy-1,4-benzoquinol methylase
MLIKEIAMKYVVFGAGRYASDFIISSGGYFEIEYCVDNYKSGVLSIKPDFELPIYNPGRLLLENKSKIMVFVCIVNNNGFVEVSDLLESYGFVENFNFLDAIVARNHREYYDLWKSALQLRGLQQMNSEQIFVDGVIDSMDIVLDNVKAFSPQKLVYWKRTVYTLQNYYRSLIDVFASILSFNNKIIDLGAGIGIAEYILKKTNTDPDITAIEIDSEYVKILNGLKTKLEFEVIQADITKMDANNYIFDITLALSVLSLIPSWQDTVLRAIRMTKPNGYIVFSFSNYRNPAVQELYKEHSGVNILELHALVEKYCTRVSLSPVFNTDDTGRLPNNVYAPFFYIVCYQKK